ncbi:MAG: AraC family transcriptional regulator [Phyllobacteriaceae bacterium]|nr:AraC family transcriptional regulator [Phyllobacteriaceae bacterium]MBA89887.1 AraC family transcriptional regulator [Phyllobacteriaceae bacterium]
MRNDRQKGWCSTVNTHARGPVPSFFLYGDEQRDQDLDTLHVEPIRERSMRHDWIIHPHVHPDHVQFLWIADGHGAFSIEGADYSAQSPALVVQPAGSLHEIRFRPGTEGRVITAAVSFVEAVAGGDQRLVDITRQPAAHTLPAGSPLVEKLGAAFGEIQNEARWEEVGRRMAIRAHMLLVLVALLRLSETRLSGTQARRDRDFEIVTRYRGALEAHFRSQKGLTFYARSLGISTQRLNTACKARAGRTASELLHERVIIEAKRNLLYTEMTVAEIGHAIGYDDPAYFNRFFSQRVGVPPGTFRADAATTHRV